MELRPLSVEAQYLLLDPNNYRFHDLPGFKVVAAKGRFAEPGVQQRAQQFLTDNDAFDVEGLKDSIEANGYVPLEQLVVEQYDEQEGKKRYLVIEGNRRLAAVRSLLEEHRGGAVNLSDQVLKSMDTLPAIEVVGTEQERKSYKQTIMAIRHIAGIKEWGAYQQAKLVVELYESGDHQFSRVAQQIGISPVEVGRRYRASRALNQMEQDDEYGRYADPKLYVFFHEAMSQPKVREWLDFDDETFRAEDEEARTAFYTLLSPREVDGNLVPPKLENANRQVRQMKDIVDKPAALKILLDPEKSFEEAVKAAEDEAEEDEEGILEAAISRASHALKQPSIDAWLSPSERARELWGHLVTLIDKIRGIIPQ